MMGMTTGPAPALFVVGAARTKEHGGALIEDEVETMMVPWQRRAIPTSQSLRIYSLTLDLTLSVNNAVLSPLGRRLSALMLFLSVCTIFAVNGVVDPCSRRFFHLS